MMSEVELLQIIHQFEEENARLTKEIARLDAVLEHKERSIQAWKEVAKAQREIATDKLGIYTRSVDLNYQLATRNDELEAALKSIRKLVDGGIPTYEQLDAALRAADTKE